MDVILSGSSPLAVTADYLVLGGTADSPEDYTLTPGKLTFIPGDTLESISIGIIDDDDTEGVETVIVGLTNPVNARIGLDLHTYSINDIPIAPFPDSDTVGLWLFDEADYPHTTLTDASVYEKADLCLMDGGSINSRGKYGREQGGCVVSSAPFQAIPDLNTPDDREHGSAADLLFAGQNAEWRRQRRFNFSVGSDRQGLQTMSGWVDEMRISRVVRYTNNFEPGSFSRNYGSEALPASTADGPAILFNPAPVSIPLEFGARKHVFIDTAIIETSSQTVLSFPRGQLRGSGGVSGNRRLRSVQDPRHKVSMGTRRLPFIRLEVSR